MSATPDLDHAVSRIAAAIGEPARARMLFTLLDNRERTSTELALAADVSPSTASVHLSRLRDEGLLRLRVQGKHRYYALAGPAVARAIEGLSVVAGGSRHAFVPNTPSRLRAARTCYDHVAGSLGVAVHERLFALGWLTGVDGGDGRTYAVTPAGIAGFERLGLDVAGIGASRRRIAYGCLDWSERRPHVGGAIGAAFLALAFRKRWLTQERDSRVLRVTGLGRRELASRLGVTTLTP